MKLITKVLVVALTLLLLSRLGLGIEIDGIYVAIIAALVLGLLNLIVKPILVLLTLPITLLTLGLFILVINAGLFLFAASFLEGFSVSSFTAAFIGSLIISLVSTVTNKLLD